MHFGIEERVDRFKQYYLRQNTRPLLGFFLESEYPVDRYKVSQKLPEERPLSPEDFNCEEYLSDYDRLYNIHEEVGGDFIWSASPFWGIPWIEAGLGCEIYKSRKSASLYSEIHKTFSKDFHIPVFDIDNPWVCKAIEFTRVISKHSKGRYPIGTPRIRGIADVLAALFGNEIFIFKFYESPALVKEICQKITDFWINFAKVILNEIPLFYGGIGSFYYNMWAPSDSVWHQEDAAALLSPKLYEEYILPCDIRIADSFGGCFMHMHPSDFYPYKQLLSTNIKCFELHIDEGGTSAEELLPVYKEILEKKPLLIWGKLQRSDFELIFNKLPAQGVAVNTVVDNVKQAQNIWSAYVGTK